MGCSLILTGKTGRSRRVRRQGRSLMEAEVPVFIKVVGDEIQHVAEAIVLLLHAPVKFNTGLGALPVWTVGVVLANLYKQSSSFVQNPL